MTDQKTEATPKGAAIIGRVSKLFVPLCIVTIVCLAGWKGYEHYQKYDFDLQWPVVTTLAPLPILEPEPRELPSLPAISPEEAASYAAWIESKVQESARKSQALVDEKAAAVEAEAQRHIDAEVERRLAESKKPLEPRVVEVPPLDAEEPAPIDPSCRVMAAALTEADMWKIQRLSCSYKIDSFYKDPLFCKDGLCVPLTEVAI